MNNQDYIVPSCDVNVFRLGKFCTSDYECCRYGNSEVFMFKGNRDSVSRNYFENKRASSL